MKNLLLLSGLIMFLACGPTNTDSSSKNLQDSSNDGVIDAVTFKKGIADLSAVQLVDVRTPKEFSEGAITGAVLINYNDDDFDAKIMRLDKQKPVYLYCKAGGRSGNTYKKLKAAGYEKVYDLEGGFSAWPYK